MLYGDTDPAKVVHYTLRHSTPVPNFSGLEFTRFTEHTNGSALTLHGCTLMLAVGHRNSEENAASLCSNCHSDRLRGRVLLTPTTYVRSTAELNVLADERGRDDRSKDIG